VGTRVGVIVGVDVWGTDIMIRVDVTGRGVDVMEMVSFEQAVKNTKQIGTR